MAIKKPMTDKAIKAALVAAHAGKGRMLATLIKSCSQADLAWAIGSISRRSLSEGEDDLLWVACVLSYVSGIREERAKWAEQRKEWRKARRSHQSNGAAITAAHDNPGRDQ